MRFLINKRCYCKIVFRLYAHYAFLTFHLTDQPTENLDGGNHKKESLLVSKYADKAMKASLNIFVDNSTVMF